MHHLILEKKQKIKTISAALSITFLCGVAFCMAGEFTGTPKLSNGHIRDGKEALATEPIILDLTNWTYDLAQGRVWRGNNKRNGVWDSTASRMKPDTLWTFDTGGPIHSSPLAWEGKVYIGTHEGLICIDAETGGRNWLYEVKGGCKSSPGIQDGVVYIGGEDAQLHAVQASTGEGVWTCKARGALGSSVALAYGLAWIGNGQGVDLQTGKIVWDSRFQKKPLIQHVLGLRTSPSVSEEYLVYPGFSGNCIEISRCKLLLGSGSTWEGQNTCALDGGVTYSVNSGAGGNSKEVVIQTRRTGKGGSVLTGFPLTKDTTQRTISFVSPAVWNGHVICANDGGELMIVSTQGRGKRLFDLELDGAIRSSPSVSKDGVLIIGSNGSGSGGFINAIDVLTGEVLWKVPTGDKVESSACLAGGVVYIGSHDGKLYALKNQ